MSDAKDLAARLREHRKGFTSDAILRVSLLLSADETDAILAALEDAERYRWLRAHSFVDRDFSAIYFGGGYNQKNPEQLDAVINAARREGA